MYSLSHLEGIVKIVAIATAALSVFVAIYQQINFDKKTELGFSLLEFLTGLVAFVGSAYVMYKEDTPIALLVAIGIGLLVSGLLVGKLFETMKGLYANNSEISDMPDFSFRLIYIATFSLLSASIGILLVREFILFALAGSFVVFIINKITGGRVK